MEFVVAHYKQDPSIKRPLIYARRVIDLDNPDNDREGWLERYQAHLAERSRIEEIRESPPVPPPPPEAESEDLMIARLRAKAALTIGNYRRDAIAEARSKGIPLAAIGVSEDE